MALIDDIREKIETEQFEFSNMLLIKASFVVSVYKKLVKSSAMLK